MYQWFSYSSIVSAFPPSSTLPMPEKKESCCNWCVHLNRTSVVVGTAVPDSSTRYWCHVPGIGVIYLMQIVLFRVSSIFFCHVVGIHTIRYIVFDRLSSVCVFFCVFFFCCCAGDIGHYYYGPGHPMKPHRLKLAHHLLLSYNLYREMDVYRPHLATSTVSFFFFVDCLFVIVFLTFLICFMIVMHNKKHEVFISPAMRYRSWELWWSVWLRTWEARHTAVLVMLWNSAGVFSFYPPVEYHLTKGLFVVNGSGL